jgi:hypothetical protein
MRDRGFANIENLEKNKEGYIQQMKKSPNVTDLGNIIVQYGGGYMVKPGSYDRYTPFENNPDADFLVIAWPLGLVQASCNPFKKERQLKGVNLGEVKDEVLEMFRPELEKQILTYRIIKRIAERKANDESVGFTMRDMEALYGKSPSYKVDQRGNASVNGYDFILSNSGGHKCITNISNQYVGRSTQKPQGRGGYSDEDSPLVKFTKMVQNEFVRVLQEKINNEK